MKYIRKSGRLREVILSLYSVPRRPHLEHCVHMRSPQYKRNRPVEACVEESLKNDPRYGTPLLRGQAEKAGEKRRLRG